MQQENHTPTIKKLSSDLSRFQVNKSNRGSERGELLDRFLAHLNPARIAEGFKPYSHARLSVMLAHIPTEDLYPFLRKCETADIPFGAIFHWSLKPQPHGNPRQA